MDYSQIINPNNISPTRISFSAPCGWKDIIVELNEKLNEIDPDHKVMQIKEKFGALRYYASFSDDVDDISWGICWDLIDEYSNKTAEACEVCGGKAKAITTKGWVHTMCDEHSKEKT
jgi:hypothetical protein